MELLDKCERGNEIAPPSAQVPSEACRRGEILLLLKHLFSNFIISTLFYCLIIEQFLIQVQSEVSQML